MNTPSTDKSLVLEQNEYLRNLYGEHLGWLRDFDEQHCLNFNKLYKHKDSYEAAMTEAAVRRWLQKQGVEVKPNEDLSGDSRQPDFHCSKNDSIFLVEATCLSIKKVSEETGLPYPFPLEDGARGVGFLTNLIWKACKKKTRQCCNSDHPVLVAVGTFHTYAYSVCLKKQYAEMSHTGELMFSMPVMTEDTKEYQIADIRMGTKLYSAAFLKPDPDKQNKIGFARSSISGLLLFDLGAEPVETLGILHPNPNPVRHFNHGIFPSIPFCKVNTKDVNQETSHLITEWTDT